MNNPIVLHVNFVEQGQTISEMCRLAAAWGYEGIEFRRKRASAPEAPEDYLDAIAAACDKTRLRHVLFGGPGPNLMDLDPAVRRRELDECLAFYRLAAARFELSVCNIMTGMLVNKEIPYFHFDQQGSAIATNEQWEWAVDGFRELGDLAAELGFRFAFETHNCFLHDLPAPTRRLVDRIDRLAVGVNLDYGNILLHPDGGSLSEAIDLLEDRIYEVHLKNLFILTGHRYYNFIPCGLGDGAINNRAMLRALKRLGYTGPLVIESPREGDRELFARQDIACLRELMKEV